VKVNPDAGAADRTMRHATCIFHAADRLGASGSRPPFGRYLAHEKRFSQSLKPVRRRMEIESEWRGQALGHHAFPMSL
jgi:hypothetical protein